MLARFNWQKSRQRVRPRLRLPAAVLGGWFILSGITAVFTFWLLSRLFWRPGWIDALPPLLREFLGVADAAGVVTLLCVWGMLWWRRRQAEKRPPAIPIMSVDDLYALDPRQFEEFVARLFRQKGYRAEVRGRSGDAGVDLMLRNGRGRRAIVQCKRYRTTVGPEIVRELYGTLIHERVAHAFLVTTADISDAAREWARGKPITLIDGRLLAQLTAALSQAP
ncbi:MAG: restriction endonuclease [Anaerolineales bacterium]|nr:restriction endonuclease [Anaerolineales bacterium]